MSPRERLRHHVSGAIERGEAEAIVERTAMTAERVKDILLNECDRLDGSAHSEYESADTPEGVAAYKALSRAADALRGFTLTASPNMLLRLAEILRAA